MANEKITPKASDTKERAREPMEDVVLKQPHRHKGKEYKAGDTVSLPKSAAEFVRKAQGIK